MSEARSAARRRLLPVTVIATAGALSLVLLLTGPDARRESNQALAPVVGVLELDRTPFERVAEAYGTVVASREVSLVPEVEGHALEIHPQLEPGGIVGEGELLLRIDPATYRAAVAGAEAALAEAHAALAIERGRQVVARREWELFGDEIGDVDLGRELALREPQLRQAEARIASAESALAAARIDLARTSIRAPFDALVVSESAEVGQRVSSAAPVAELVGVEHFWVRASLPLARLPAVLGLEGETKARVRLAPGLGEGVMREGRLVRSLGRVESEGRMAQVLIAIEDPLGLAGGPAIPLGSYVRVELDAGPLADVVRIPRHSVRENGELWVSDEGGQLQVRAAEVVWRQGEYVAVRDVFAPGDRLIVTSLASAVPGMALRPRSAVEGLTPVPAPEPMPIDALADTPGDEDRSRDGG